MTTIDFLKETGSTNLIGIGFYYKQDTPDGWSFHAMKKQPMWDFISDIEKDCQRLFELEMTAIKEQSEGYEVSLNDFQLDTFNMLHRLIKEFWIGLGYSDGKQPINKNIDVEINEERAQLIMAICIQIFYLSKWDLIPNDNYNGMSYNYSNFKF